MAYVPGPSSNPPERRSDERSPKRVVIIDDHPLIRTGLQRMIAGNGFVVCGEAATAANGIRVVRELKPDIAIVDIGLPDHDGIYLTGQLTKEFPRLGVLVLSMHSDWEYAARALEAGATGYMVKHDAVEKIESALQQVLSGQLYLSPSIVGEIGLDAFLNERATGSRAAIRSGKRAAPRRPRAQKSNS